MAISFVKTYYSHFVEWIKVKFTLFKDGFYLKDKYDRIVINDRNRCVKSLRYKNVY